MAKKVTIYSTPTCGYCQMAKEFFQEHQVAYTEYNVQADRARAQEMIKKSGQMGVPVIAISNEAGGEEQIIIGFDQRGLKQALGL